MAKTELLKYPPSLTNSAWQKKKGTLGKAKKTGVGETLTALEKRFALSQFADADTAKALDGDADPYRYLKHRAKLAPAVLDADLRKLDPLIKDAEKKIFLARNTFASNRAVSDYLAQLGKDLTKFRADLGSKTTYETLAVALDAQLKVNVKANQICQMTQMAADLFAKRVTQVLQDIKKLQSQQPLTISAVESIWSDGNSGGRGLATTINQWDTFAGHLPPKNRLTLPPKLTAQQIYADSSLRTFGALPWIGEVGDMKAAAKMRGQVKGNTTEADVVTKMLDEYEDSVKQLAPLLKHFKDLAGQIKNYL